MSGRFICFGSTRAFARVGIVLHAVFSGSKNDFKGQNRQVLSPFFVLEKVCRPIAKQLLPRRIPLCFSLTLPPL